MRPASSGKVKEYGGWVVTSVEASAITTSGCATSTRCTVSFAPGLMTAGTRSETVPLIWSGMGASAGWPFAGAASLPFAGAVEGGLEGLQAPRTTSAVKAVATYFSMANSSRYNRRNAS